MSGIALVGATVIAAAPIAATSRDVEIANPAVQLTATPFEEYQALISNSLKNIQGLIEQALAAPLPPSDLRFTLDSLISGLFDVNANIAAFQKELSGRHGARSHGQGLRWRLGGAPRHPIRLPPLPDRLTPAPMLSRWFIRFHGAQGGDMFARRFADEVHTFDRSSIASQPSSPAGRGDIAPPS